MGTAIMIMKIRLHLSSISMHHSAFVMHNVKASRIARIYQQVSSFRI